MLIVVLLAAGAVLARYHVDNQRYFPVSKLASADGYTFYVVQDRVETRRECGEANDRFLKPIKATCPQCEIVYARCERELQGLELALMMGDAVPLHVIMSPSLRLAVDGPARAVRQDCEHIATAIVNSGEPAAACVFPGTQR
ncbi:MAG: hypothetical protein WD886_07400 [Burkholderiales bacterium]